MSITIARRHLRTGTGRRITGPAARLWAAQAVLAVVFAFAGASKLITPADVLADQSNGFAVEFIRFVGVCEVLGAAGLILPGVLRTARWLTPLAAAGLAAIMTGAVVSTIALMGVLPAALPLVVGLLCVYVIDRRAPRTTRALRTRIAW